MCGARPLRALRRVHPRGGARRWSDLWRIVQSMRDAAAAPGRAHRHRRHQGRRPRQGRRHLHQHRRASASSAAGIELAPTRPARRRRAPERRRSPSTASRSCRCARGSSSRRRSRATRRRCTTWSRPCSSRGGEAVHVLRDPTRGGVASALNEIAEQAGPGIVLEERAIPVREEVRGACEILGPRPALRRQRGQVPRDRRRATRRTRALAAMRAHPLGRDAAIIGEVVEEHPEGGASAGAASAACASSTC